MGRIILATVAILTSTFSWHGAIHSLGVDSSAVQDLLANVTQGGTNYSNCFCNDCHFNKQFVAIRAIHSSCVDSLAGQDQLIHVKLRRDKSSLHLQLFLTNKLSRLCGLTSPQFQSRQTNVQLNYDLFSSFVELAAFCFPLPMPSAAGLVFGSAQACCFHMAAFGIQDSLSEVVERSQWILCLCISFNWCLFLFPFLHLPGIVK